MTDEDKSDEKYFYYQKKIQPGSERKKLSSGTNGIKEVSNEYKIS